MSASEKPVKSPLRQRLDLAQVAISEMEDMGLVVAGMTATPDGVTLILRDHPANKKLIGWVRRIYQDSAGRWIELEMVLEAGVRIRWLRPWSAYTHLESRSVH